MSPPFDTSIYVGPNDSAKYLSNIMPVSSFAMASLPIAIGAPGAITTPPSAYIAANAATSFASADLVHAASADRIAASSTGRVSTAAAGCPDGVGVELHAANPKPATTHTPTPTMLQRLLFVINDLLERELPARWPRR